MRDAIIAAAALGAAALCLWTWRQGKRLQGYAPPRILLFGDSITQQSFSVGGWGARLSDQYQRYADVVNRGFSGYNTRWALELLAGPQLRDSEQRTVLVTIFFGANDASLPEHNLRQHVPLDEFKANLRTIVAHFREQCPSAAILLITPPPVCHEQRIAFQRQRFPNSPSGVLERTNENAGVYADAVANVAQELGLPCVNLWAELQAAAPGDGWHVYLSDGLHLSVAGNLQVAELVLAQIQASYPFLAVSPDPHTGNLGNSGTTCTGIPPNGPWHDKIDSNDPAAAFALCPVDLMA
jgi:lysophospholipase L1-like esterase